MTLNYIWRWGSISEVMENVQDFFIAIITSPTLTQSDSTCSAPIYGSNKSVWKFISFNRNT